jgi:DNA-binding transcriptional ArsR family regulator
MPRAATTTDAFNAIAEPRRRELIDVLAGGRAVAVGELVRSLGLPQPAVSKHLSVLRRVGIVTVRKQGRHRLYQLNPRKLKPVHDWVAMFEQFWTHQLDRVRERAEQAQACAADAATKLIASAGSASASSASAGSASAGSASAGSASAGSASIDSTAPDSAGAGATAVRQRQVPADRPLHKPAISEDSSP